MYFSVCSNWSSAATRCRTRTKEAEAGWKITFCVCSFSDKIFRSKIWINLLISRVRVSAQRFSSFPMSLKSFFAGPKGPCSDKKDRAKVLNGMRLIIIGRHFVLFSTSESPKALCAHRIEGYPTIFRETIRIWPVDFLPSFSSYCPTQKLLT